MKKAKQENVNKQLEEKDCQNCPAKFSEKNDNEIY